MLVLSRYESQSIVIADGIVVTVLEINRGQVRIGIDAPREVNVARTELLDRQDNNLYHNKFAKKLDRK